MKPLSPIQKTLIQALAFGAVMAAPLLLAQSGLGPKFLPEVRQQANKDRTTALKLAHTITNHHQGFGDAARSEQAPAAVTESPGIYTGSIILRHGSTHTVVPKNSVIHLPDHLQGKITRSPEGRYIPWPKFYTANRSWLLTHQVTLDQASGKDPIKPNARTQLKSINRIVVSVYQNHPISKLPTR